MKIQTFTYQGGLQFLHKLNALEIPQKIRRGALPLELPQPLFQHPNRLPLLIPLPVPTKLLPSNLPPSAAPAPLSIQFNEPHRVLDLGDDRVLDGGEVDADPGPRSPFLEHFPAEFRRPSELRELRL